MRVLVLGLFVVSTLTVPFSAWADSIYGECYASNGETCAKSNHTISTSWNGKKAFPDSHGQYELDLGNKVESTITVYCDGDSVGSVHVDGATHFSVHCR